jgi:hypothetical protein
MAEEPKQIHLTDDDLARLGRAIASNVTNGKAWSPMNILNLLSLLSAIGVFTLFFTLYDDHRMVQDHELNKVEINDFHRDQRTHDENYKDIQRIFREDLKIHWDRRKLYNPTLRSAPVSLSKNKVCPPYYPFLCLTDEQKERMIWRD